MLGKRSEAFKGTSGKKEEKQTSAMNAHKTIKFAWNAYNCSNSTLAIWQQEKVATDYVCVSTFVVVHVKIDWCREGN